MKRGLWTRFLTAALVTSLSFSLFPACAQQPAASLAGLVLTAGGRAPLPGATVYAGDPRAGKVYPSRPTAEDGSFTLAGLPAATYRLSVGFDGGLYLLEAPLSLAAGQERQVNLAIHPDQEAAAAEDPTDPPRQKGAATIWSNPLTASLIVLGAAVVVGLLVEGATHDEDQASPF